MKNRPSTLNHLSAAILVEALMHGPATVFDISAETGVSYITTRRYVRALHKRGCIYVAEWHEDLRGRRNVRAFTLGRKPDAPRPPKITHAARQAAYRERARVVQVAMMAIAA